MNEISRPYMRGSWIKCAIKKLTATSRRRERDNVRRASITMHSRSTLRLQKVSLMELRVEVSRSL